MAKEIIRRSAADNFYLHKDFHGALSVGLAYLEQHFGADAVSEYLRQFALTFYAPLSQAIRERGLIALHEHLEQIYALEGGGIQLTCSQDELLLEVERCPAITHMRRQGYAVAPLFYETSRTVYAAICESTPFVSEWLRYDRQTGGCAVRFHRRQP